MLFNGQLLADKITHSLKKKINKLSNKPTLLIYVARNDRKGQHYSRLIQAQAKKIKIEVVLKQFNLANKPQFDLKKSQVNGILIQKPDQVLRKKYFSSNKEFEIWWLSNTSQIPEKKDIDCLNVANLGLLTAGLIQFYPATVKAIYKILIFALKGDKNKLAGKKATILGASEIIGKPLSMLLRNHNLNVSLVAENGNPRQYTTMSDIIISAVGKPRLVTASMLKKKSIVIDAGFSYEGGLVVGDVDFDKVKKKASFITSVPGGVGPVTIACLLENVYLAFLKQN